MSDIRIFYKSLDGGKSVSANFRVREFACKDGADIIPIDMELVKVLQNVRDHFKMPVTVNSAYRTPAYNKKVGGVNASQHIRGTAADITVKGVAPDKVYAYLNGLYPDKYGIGKYPTFTHIDTRTSKARW
ncbi:MAG: DUF882 domain-containing protein [Oscillibacter sp.]|nr:DUF882 domain-containing protein [Oscillibacter sp.]